MMGPHAPEISDDVDPSARAQWYTSVRKIITDPAYAGFFLHFGCNSHGP
jgi:hypothetical protein